MLSDEEIVYWRFTMHLVVIDIGTVEIMYINLVLKYGFAFWTSAVYKGFFFIGRTVWRKI